MSYTQAISQLRLAFSQGWEGIQAVNDNLESRGKIARLFSLLNSLEYSSPNAEVQSVVQRKVALINQTHRNLTSYSPLDEKAAFFESQSFFEDWNDFVMDNELKIHHQSDIETQDTKFTPFRCYYQNPGATPLFVERKGDSPGLISWANAHQQEIAQEITTHGAIVFRGFDIDAKSFPLAFKAITGRDPDTYKGGTPRKEEGKNIYHSTAVAEQHYIPLHQEVSYRQRQFMPDYLSFFCDTAPAPGTGQTILGDTRVVTTQIQESAPDLWQLISTQNLTYTTRYLPSHSWRTSWIQKLNPSHATILKQFGTEDPIEVERLCGQQGQECRWDHGWAIVSNRDIPATVEVGGTTLFCNELHLDKFSPGLCGGKAKYLLGRSFLYQTEDSTQFDVAFSDGTPVTHEMADRILGILKQNAIVNDWQKGDLLILNNKTVMHGKAPHSGPRKILVAMA